MIIDVKKLFVDDAILYEYHWTKSCANNPTDNVDKHLLLSASKLLYCSEKKNQPTIIQNSSMEVLRLMDISLVHSNVFLSRPVNESNSIEILLMKGRDISRDILIKMEFDNTMSGLRDFNAVFCAITSLIKSF